MGYALPISVQMTDMECGECGIQFAVPESWRAEKQRTGKGWHCPNGHARAYIESDVKRLEKQLAEAHRTNTALAEQVRQAQIAERKATAERKRIAKRISAGVCMCCNRTFQNLARHMKTKHAETIGG
jgi:transposase-like protein